MNLAKNLFDIKKASLLVLMMPYIGFNWVELYQSPSYNFKYVLVLLGILLAVEFFFKFFMTFKIFSSHITPVFITLALIFFYGFYAVSFLQSIVGLNVRGRIIIAIMIPVLMIVVYLFNRRASNYRSANTYFLIFGTITALGQLTEIKKKSHPDNTYQSKYLHIAPKAGAIKPVVLIIADEYSSPTELFKVVKDSSIFDFSSELKERNWIVNNNAYSYDNSTIHSLSSMFNYNLSTGGEYDKNPIADVVINKLMHARLYDSLKSKQVKTINYGIFDFGEYAPLNKLLFYPTNFFEEFFYQTSFFRIVYGTGKFNKNGFSPEFSSMEIHNKYLISKLKNHLDEIIGEKYFVYVHLYMPHGPYIFKPNFKGGAINLDNYLNYWGFTNEKLSVLLNSIAKDNKYKLILTGDHGFRNQSMINSHNTFTAFFGFDQQSADSIKSVQDLGSLINSSF